MIKAYKAQTAKCPQRLIARSESGGPYLVIVCAFCGAKSSPEFSPVDFTIMHWELTDYFEGARLTDEACEAYWRTEKVIV